MKGDASLSYEKTKNHPPKAIENRYKFAINVD